MTKVKLELISIADIHFFGKGMRNRVSYASKRYSEANNRYLKSNYNPKKIKTYMLRRK